MSPSPLSHSTTSSTCSCWCGLHAHIKYTQCTHGDGQSKRLHSVSTWHAVLKPKSSTPLHLTWGLHMPHAATLHTVSTLSPLERTSKMTTTRSTKKKMRMKKKKKLYFALSVHLNRFIRPQLVSARVAGGPHNHRKCRRCCHPQWHRNRSQTAGNVYRKRITGKLNQYNCNSIIVALIIERRRLSHAQQTHTHMDTHTYTLTYTLPRVYAALSFRWLQLQLQLRVRLTFPSKYIFPFSARFHSVHSKTFSKHTHTYMYTHSCAIKWLPFGHLHM